MVFIQLCFSLSQSVTVLKSNVIEASVSQHIQEAVIKHSFSNPCSFLPILKKKTFNNKCLVLVASAY